MKTQKLIDNHYMYILRKNAGGGTVEEHEGYSIALLRFESSLLVLGEEGDELALDYITSPIDERYKLTSFYDADLT